MRRMKVIALAMMSLSAWTAQSAIAATALPMGWYLEGNAGQSNVSRVNYGAGTKAGRGGLGWGVNAGYKFMPFFAAEVGYIKYDDIMIKNAAGGEAAKAKNYSLDIAGKGMIPIGVTGIELFAKLGIARVHSQTVITNVANASRTGIINGSHNANGVFLGFGADYSIMPNLPVNIQWTRAVGTSRTGNLDLFSVGIGYIFG